MNPEEDSLASLLQSFAKAPIKASLTASDLVEALEAVPLKRRYSIIAKTKFNDGKTFLHRALERGCAELVSCLLQHVTEEDGKKLLDSGRPVLHAAMLQSAEKVKHLLESIPSTNRHIFLMSRDGEGKTSLHCASSFGSAAAVKCILDSLEEEKKQDLLLMQDKEGSTALHLAITSQSEDTVKCILDCIEPENIHKMLSTQNNKKKTSLHYACMSGCAHTVQHILNSTVPTKRLELLSMTDDEGMTLLHIASKTGSVDKVRFLIDSIADNDRSSLLMIQDNEGKTPLHYSSQLKSTEKLKHILSSVAEENRNTLTMMKDREGKTSLHHCSRSGTSDSLKCILDSLTPENQQSLLMMQDNDGMTSLHLAISDHSEVVQKVTSLLQHLPLHRRLELLESKNGEGKTATEMAMAINSQDAVNVLKDFHGPALENTIPATIDVEPTPRLDSPKRGARRTPHQVKQPVGQPAQPPPPTTESSLIQEPAQDLSLHRSTGPFKPFSRPSLQQSPSLSDQTVHASPSSQASINDLSWTQSVSSYLGMLQQPIYTSNQSLSYSSTMPYILPAPPSTAVTPSFQSLTPSSVPSAESSLSSQSMAYVTPFNQGPGSITTQPTFTSLEPIRPKKEKVTIVTKHRPILPADNSGADRHKSNDYAAMPSMVGIKRMATSELGAPGHTPVKQPRFESAIEGETVKMISGGDRYLFMFPPNNTVGDFTSDVQSMTGTPCAINTLDGFVSSSSVLLKSLPIPFIISAGGSETIINSRPEQFDGPGASSSIAEDTSKKQMRFGRMASAGQVVELLSFVHDHVASGKTINAALKLAEKDRKTVDRFKNIYYLHVTNSKKLNELDLEWQRKGRPDALPGLNEMARKAMDWKVLRDMADEGKATLFGGIQDE